MVLNKLYYYIMIHLRGLRAFVVKTFKVTEYLNLLSRYSCFKF